MATRETLIGFESAVDFVIDRVGSMDLCDDDRTSVGGFLEKLADEVTKRKVQQIELVFLNL